MKTTAKDVYKRLISALSGGGAAPAFTASDYGTAIVHLDASDSSTRTIVTGVSQLDDKTGNGNHVSQADTADQPAVISAAQNGLDVLEFDGVDGCLFRTTFTGGQITMPHTLFLVVDTLGSSGIITLTDGGSNGFRSSLFVATATNFYTQFAGGSQATMTAAVTGWTLMRMVQNFTANELWRNGTRIDVGAGSVGVNTMNGLHIASRYGGTANNANMRFAELIQYDGLLSAGNIAAVESHLTTKWGL